CAASPRPSRSTRSPESTSAHGSLSALGGGEGRGGGGMPERSHTPTSPSHASGVGPSLSAVKGGEGKYRGPPRVAYLYLAVIVVACTFSLWAIPIGYGLGVERLGRGHLVGAAVGFAGLVLFMNPGLVDWQSGQVLFGNAMLLLAAIAWALGSCLYRRRIWRSGFWAQTFWQLAVSTPVVAAVVLGEAMDQPIRWSGVLVAVLAYNWVVTTALGYFWWGKVLAVMPASIAGQVLALTP